MTMQFTPAPLNDFSEFIETYYTRCRHRVPQIDAIAGKWTFPDLIPGMSDFDTRFILQGPMNAADWCAMSMQVAQVHLELAQERKEWARTLEHLPGVNLTWGELLDERFYYPEFAQWSFYHGDKALLQQFETMVAQRSWSHEEAVFHWKKVALYYGPYNRSIDPPINLGRFESKYPLHSRIMHYFAPPVHSLVCLKQCRTTPGKIESFRAAQEFFPNPDTIQLVLDLIKRHYEVPEYLTEPGQTKLERLLEQYLCDAVDNLHANYDWLEFEPSPTVAQLKAAIAQHYDPLNISQLFDHLKFARLMQGRLWFFAQHVPWFDSLPLIRIEMNRLRSNFFELPLQIYAKNCLGTEMTGSKCVEALTGNELTVEQATILLAFDRLVDPTTPDAEFKAKALQIVNIYPSFLQALETLTETAITQTMS